MREPGKPGNPVEPLERRVLLTGVSFNSGNLFPAGGDTVKDFAVGDFNGDGKPDLAAVNPATGTLSILLGNGDGTFHSPIPLAAGNDPAAVAAGDVNSDGATDIVVADDGSTSILIFFGNGNGTFQAPQAEQVYGNARSVVVSDLTNNGRQDILVESTTAENVTALNVFLNTAAGGLVAEPVFFANEASNNIILADVNGDGAPDLVLPGYGVTNNEVGVLLNNGNATFEPAVTFATGGDSYSAVVADFTGGPADIAVANQADGTVGLLIGNGNGTFQTMQTIASGGAVGVGYLLGPADLNGDGRQDLLWSESAPVLDFLAGNGNGTFAAPQQVATVTNGEGTKGRLVDVNGDGQLDIVISYYDGLIATHLNTSVGGNVSFGPAIGAETGATYAKNVVSADVNGDSKVDLLVSNETSNDISVFFSNGNGTFQAPQTFAAGLGPQGLAVADFTGDGAPDVAVCDSNDYSVAILMNNGNGTFAAPAIVDVENDPKEIVAKDLNGDGKVDLVITYYHNSGIAVLLGNGNGTFQAAQFLPSGPGPQHPVVKDINNDGAPDILVADSYGTTISVFLNNGNGTFAAQQTFSTNGEPNTLTVNDLTGDGVPDVVAAVNYSSTVSSALGILVGNGNGTFQPMRTLAVAPGSQSYVLPAAALNGDGVKELLWANGQTDTSLKVDVLLSNANGTFTSPVEVAELDQAPGGVTESDLNGDGKLDLAFTYKYVGLVSVRLNTSGGGVAMSGDTLMATGSMGNDDVSVKESGSVVTIDFDGAVDTFSMTAGEGIVIDPGAGNDSVSLGQNLTGATVGGGGGNDTITTRSADDSLRGGQGNDLIVAGGTSGVQTGIVFSPDAAGASSDTAVGGAGNDTLATGGSGEDLFGGPGGDVFINSGGSGDSIDGGTGLNIAQSNGQDSFGNIFEFYAVNPQDAQPAFTSETVSGELQVFGTTGDDSITMSDDGMGNLIVTVNGVPQAFAEAGLTGVLLAGGEGDDTIVVDPSVTLQVDLRGAKGDDSLVGGGGDNVIVGGAGNDTLVGGEGTNDLAPGRRVTFEDSPSGNDVLIGGPPGSVNYADFAYREDNLFLSNDGKPDSGDTQEGEATTIMPSVQNILAGTGMDTIVSTTAASFLAAGIGQDSIVSGGSSTLLVAGPPGAGSDTVVANGVGNGLFLLNGHADTYEDTVAGDIVQTDGGVDSLGT